MVCLCVVEVHTVDRLIVHLGPCWSLLLCCKKDNHILHGRRETWVRRDVCVRHKKNSSTSVRIRHRQKRPTRKFSKIIIPLLAC